MNDDAFVLNALHGTAEMLKEIPFLHYGFPPLILIGGAILLWFAYTGIVRRRTTNYYRMYGYNFLGEITGIAAIVVGFCHLIMAALVLGIGLPVILAMWGLI